MYPYAPYIRTYVPTYLPTPACPPAQEVEEIEKIMDRDFYMDAEEAIEFGVVDKMLTKRPKEVVGS